MIRCLALGDSHISKRAKAISNRLIDELNGLPKVKLLDYIFVARDLIDISLSANEKSFIGLT